MAKTESIMMVYWIITSIVIIGVMLFLSYLFLLSQVGLPTAPQQRCTDSEFIQSVRNSNVDELKLLIQKKRYIIPGRYTLGWRSCRNGTALEIAAKDGNHEMFAYLLTLGAQIDHPNPELDFKKTFDKANIGGNEKIIQYMVSKIETPHHMEVAFRSAVKYKNISLAKLLLKNGADIGSDLTGNGSVLVQAACNNDLEMVELIISEGIDINQSGKPWGDSPITCAARHGNNEVVKKLVEYGANVNPKKYSYYTPLMWAVSNGDAELSLYLVQRGADKKVTDQSGDTAYDIAHKIPSFDPQLIATFEEILRPNKRRNTDSGAIAPLPVR